MRVAIYGAGAMGTVLGAHLARAELKVDLISRNKQHISALKKHGAKICGTVNFTVPVFAYLPEEMTGKYDVIFLMTKQRDNENTVKFLLNYLADDGVICTTQNGLPERLIASICGEERCIGCAVSWGATFIGEGVAKLTSSPDKLTFAIGSLYKNNPHIYAVQRILERMGKVYLCDNFIGARWAKLSVNCAFSSLSALSGLTFGEIAKGKKAKKIAQAILKESFDIAKASGVKIDKIQGHDIVKLLNYNNPVKRAISLALIPLTMKKHANLQSGMLFDLLNGKVCDIDFLNGVLINYANECGVGAPVNERVVELIHKIERGELTVSPNNLNLIKIPQ
ncbi:MAG: ketopantoate reductase family protein [Clostridia bacterium]|nr:ketopantoate reductase family protein [Clostridia bacterium]